MEEKASCIGDYSLRIHIVNLLRLTAAGDVLCLKTYFSYIRLTELFIVLQKSLMQMSVSEMKMQCLEILEALLPSSGHAVHKKSIWMTERVPMHFIIEMKTRNKKDVT